MCFPATLTWFPVASTTTTSKDASPTDDDDDNTEETTPPRLNNGQRVASPLALLMGAVAAIMFFN
jgi:hypothetical protein